ncbi:MAG TPA: hypothetical protein VGO56_19085 [Pyrinomonadaceae bacterium]|nr:hypothetical protein [Pyrinomonadaceae bacterium]
MSKRITRSLLLVFVAALALVGLLLSHSAAVSAQRANAVGAPARNAAVVTATAEVLSETSEIRELTILRPVPSGAQSRADIERMLVKNLNDDMTAAEMHATEVSLRKFGLAPRDFEYRPFIIKLLTEQVAGYYDPKAGEFHLADWLDLEGQKPVMAHELTHALQDQHFNLRRFEKWPKGDSDAELAAHALVEGDATLAMMLYLARNPLAALAFSRSLTAGVATEQYDQAPRAMRESLIFPYMQGSDWARQLYKRGGWTMVSNAFTKLPLSTEQILHAEKYFKYERPVQVTLPDVTSLLNGGSKQQSAVSNQHSAKRRLPTANRPLPTAAWHRIDSDVNGEWTYYLILDQFLAAPDESKRAAAGWAGDRYALYEGPNGDVFLAQVAVWDTENDAREFFDAYVKRTELRYPGAKPLDSTDSELETKNTYSWQTSEGKVTIELRGSRVVILEGIPVGLEAGKLLKAFAQ